MVRPPYYLAVRLVQVAAANWERIDGGAAGRGVNPFGLRFDRFLNFIWDWALERVADPEKWRSGMEAPPPVPVGAEPRAPSQREVDVEADSFVAFFDQYQRGVV